MRAASNCREGNILSVVIPVKQIDATAMQMLVDLALKAPAVTVLAVGKVVKRVEVEPENLRVFDCDCALYEAMNTGAMQASTRYLLFMGIDDQLLWRNVPTVVAKLADFADADLVVLPFCVGSRTVNQTASVSRLKSYHHQGVIFCRLALLESGGYGLRYRLHSDLDLMFRMQSRGSVGEIGVPLVQFTKGGISTSGRHAIVSIREFSAIYKDHGVSRMAFDFAFSVALLIWYRLRFVTGSLFSARSSERAGATKKV